MFEEIQILIQKQNLQSCWKKKGTWFFYPFRDIGIDILAYKDGKVELYQLKARNEHGKIPNYYRFSIRKDMEKNR